MERRFTIVLSQATAEDALVLARLDRRRIHDQLAWVVEEWVRRERHRLATAPDADHAEPPVTDILSAAAAIG